MALFKVRDGGVVLWGAHDFPFLLKSDASNLAVTATDAKLDLGKV
jgi:hypothetical protein